MRVATWNVNSIRTRAQQVVDWLQNNSIDVLCLQETKVTDENFPKAAFAGLDYYLYFSGQKAYNGVAIFSRLPLEEVKIGFSAILDHPLARDFDSQKRIISGAIGDLWVVDVYVPNGAAVGGEKYEYKLEWLKMLREYLQVLRDRSSKEICLCGDFNVALEDRDIYDPKNKEKHIMSSPLERQALRAVLAVGFEDVFRKFVSESGYFSWWDYRTNAFKYNRGWRIDHHYMTPALYDRAFRCQIDLAPRKLTQPSDHAPVIVEF